MIGNYRLVWAMSFRIVRLFFTSEVRRVAITWACLLLALLASLSGLNVLNSFVARYFMTAITDRDTGRFVNYALIYAGIFIVSSIASAYYRYSEERLRLQWRAWLTGRLIDRYMSNDAYLRLKTREEVDNPDQRITEDVKSYTQTTLSFFLLTLNAVITSLAFLGVLWSITPWLVLVAILYAAIGSAATIVLGRPLVRLDNLQLKKEADLRHYLIETRETAEAIAVMRAGRMIRDCLRICLAAVVANNKLIIRVSRNLGFFTNAYNYMTQLIPLLIVAPLYIRGEVEFGVVTQSAMAFSAFLGGFSLIVTQFETLSSFAAVTTRLHTIVEAIEQAQVPPPTAIVIEQDETRVAYERLTLRAQREHHVLIKDLSMTIPYGHNLLITGPDVGAASALFLATAGLWEEGEGRIARPGKHGMYFVPRQLLSVRCTLRSQLVATSPGRRFTDDDILAALRKVGLGPMLTRVGGLHVEFDGPRQLSPGERRLLALARVLLAAPRFVFLDRMDGDLRPDQLEQIYGLLRGSSISYLSIGEPHSLLAYHDTVLELQGEGVWRVKPAREAA